MGRIVLQSPPGVVALQRTDRPAVPVAGRRLAAAEPPRGRAAVLTRATAPSLGRVSTCSPCLLLARMRKAGAPRVAGSGRP